MILVVADTSPIHYLVLIDAIDVLAKLYDRVVIPTAVYGELTHRNAPEAVRRWAAALPRWAEVKTPSGVELQGILDPGEAEAIALAQELKTDYLLLDEIEARKMALARGLAVSGTVGVLEKAADRELLSLANAFQRLLQTNFRIDRQLLQDALARDAARNELARTPDRDHGIDR